MVSSMAQKWTAIHRNIVKQLRGRLEPSNAAHYKSFYCSFRSQGLICKECINASPCLEHHLFPLGSLTPAAPHRPVTRKSPEGCFFFFSRRLCLPVFYQMNWNESAAKMDTRLSWVPVRRSERTHAAANMEGRLPNYG